MRRVTFYLSIAAVIVTMFLLVASVYSFRLSKPDGNLATAGDALEPTDFPPFLHWDLREFDICLIPYSYGDGTPDFVGEFMDVDDAFMAWEDVEPSLIGFFNVDPPGPGASDPLVLDQWNMIGWNGTTANPGDDVCLLGAGVCVVGDACAPGAQLIGPGPDGWLTTVPENDDYYFDTGGGNFVIRDGGNGIINTAPNITMSAGTLGITALFFEVSSGRILESDILLNDAYTWQRVDHNDPMGGNPDVQMVVTHEIGHFIGLHHPPGGGDSNPPGPMMNPFVNLNGNANHELANDDRDGCNFLYTPDLGDAPDPEAAFNRYPTLVHDPLAGRLLNDMTLDAPARGAEHLFGIRDSLGNLYRNGDYQYEWLGPNIDDSPDECEALVTDLDEYDDGVEFLWDWWGNLVGIRFLVSTNGNPARYTLLPDIRTIFVNAWLDVNNDKDWDDTGEWLTIWSGAPGFGGWPVADNSRWIIRWFPPKTWPDDAWFRIRLDWAECVGIMKNIDGTLGATRGAAQFGEVQDYPHETNWEPYHGWHYGYDYYAPELWPSWEYPSIYYEPCQHLWIDVPWWWWCYTFPPPVETFLFGIAVPQSFLDLGWGVNNVALKEYAPDGGGTVLAELVPDESVSAELNADFDMDDGSVWFGYSLTDYDLADTFNVLYYELACPDETTESFTGNFHFIAGDNMYGWSPELYTDVEVTVGGCDCGVWGDVTGDGNINPVDVVYMVNFVYLSNDMRVQPPNCPRAAGDVNCDGAVNPVDVVFYVNYVYLGNNMFCADPCGQ